MACGNLAVFACRAQCGEYTPLTVQTLGAGECLILGQRSTDSSFRVYFESSLKLNSQDFTAPTWPKDAYDVSGPLVCWRTRAVPAGFKNIVEGAGNVHYLCVTSWVLTDSYDDDTVRRAGAHAAAVLRLWLPIQRCTSVGGAWQHSTPAKTLLNSRCNLLRVSRSV